MATLVDVRRLNFSVRTMSALDRLGVKRLGDLAPLRAEAVRRMPNVGSATMEELERTLSRFDLSFDMAIPVWRKLDIERLAARKAEELEKLRIQALWLNEEVGSPKSIAAEVRLVLKDRMRLKHWEIVESWLGYHEPEPPTLQEIGLRYSVSREWVRVVVDCTRERIARANPPMPLLTAAMSECTSFEFGSMPAGGRRALRVRVQRQSLSIGCMSRLAHLFSIPAPWPDFEGKLRKSKRGKGVRRGKHLR